MIAQSTMISGEGLKDHRVVLYRRVHAFHPYVVHYQAEDGSRWHGSYCATLSEAVEEFDSRCAKRNVVDEAATPHAAPA